MNPEDLQIRSLAVGHLPVIRACLDQLGILDVLDAHLPRHPLARASESDCVAMMVLNVLSGRVALWRMDTRFEHIDLELLLGEGARAEWFHDARLGRALDRIDAVGTDTLLSEVVLRYLQNIEPEPFSVHLDHTTLSLYGDYAAADAGPRPARGHSKDHRPDLKQLVFGMAVHGAAGIPLTMGLHSGNTSDHTANRDHLTRLAALLPKPDDVTIVADCKLVDGETLGLLTGAGFHFVSLVPRTVGARRELIERAWSEQPDVARWPLLAETPGDKKADPPRRFRGRTYTGHIPLRGSGESVVAGRDAAEEANETVRGTSATRPAASVSSASDGGTPPPDPTHRTHTRPQPEASAPEPARSRAKPSRPMRCVVIHSDALAGHFDEALPAKLAREAESVTALHGRVLNKSYACEADARAAMEPLLARLQWHTATITVDAVTVTEKRASPGRPRKDAPPPASHTVWVPHCSLSPDADAIEAERRQASCFVLVTDWPEDAWSDARVLAEYRHQSVIEGHTGFRWLKGPAAVAPVFLETPTRIRALGLVFVFALMVRNFVQHRLRRAIKEQAKPVAHPIRRRRRVDNLTTEMAMVWFEGVSSICVRLGNGPWTRRAAHLAPEAVEILELLGVDVGVFTRPPPRAKFAGGAG